MPSFHTKTIELILDPVAQQVSELVILHEASEDGSAMPDLSQQIAVVSAAVQNLVRVGRETTNSSKDTVLKQDMPPALNKVEEASNGLLQASLMLRDDPYSVSARKTLIEGSRGILSGTAQLLLVFDQAEVRKILKHCQGVLDYIVVAEVIEGMQDLVTFVKNLTPGMTAMANMVSARAKELTFQIHRELLEKHLDSVKSMVPLLVSAIKITVTTISQGGAGLKEAHENRNYVIKKMCYDIREIMRVLQLTTYDEDDWAMDDITVLKKAQDNIASQMNRAQEWLSDPNAAPGGIGESALRQILADSRKVADRVNEPYARNIRGAVDELTQLTDRLAELRAKGLGNTPEAQQLSNAINAKLVALQKLVDTAVQDAVRNGTGKPASTLTGKMEQAQAWLANPLINDKGVGREAIKGLVKEGRKVAQSLSGPERKELEALCDDVETLYSQLDALIRKGMGNSPEAQAIKQQLAQKLQALQQKIEKALATQVVDTFMDPLGPLNHLEKAAKAPADEPNRERTYESKATIFLRHGKQMADTAKSVAEAGSCPDKKVVGELNATANDVAEMTPQLVFAGKLVLINPGNAAATENFDKLRDKYKEKVDSLTGLVDEATDAVEFIKASEESIKQDSEEVASAIRERNSANIVLKGGNIARKARRIVTVANKEADNSEDPEFVNNVKDATKKLDKSTADTVRSAKAISMNPTDSAAQNNWFKSNGELLIDIERVKRPLIVIIPVEQQQPPPVAMPIRSSQQANLEQAPPPSRNLYTASSPQYQPSGSSSASPYASQSEGVKASPIQGDVFARPQYVGSASRPSEYGPPVPPPPAFEQASPKKPPQPAPTYVAPSVTSDHPSAASSRLPGTPYQQAQPSQADVHVADVTPTQHATYHVQPSQNAAPIFPSQHAVQHVPCQGNLAQEGEPGRCENYENQAPHFNPTTFVQPNQHKPTHNASSTEDKMILETSANQPSVQAVHSRELPIEGQLQHSQNAPFHLQHSHSDPQAVIVPHPLTSQSQQPSQTVTSCEVKSIPAVAGGFQQSQHAPAVPDQPGQWSESEQTASDTPPEILSSEVQPSQHASPYFQQSHKMSDQDESSQHASALPMSHVELSHHASEHKQPIQQAYCEADIPVEFALTQNRPSQHASHLNQTTLPLLAQGHASPSQNAPEFYRSSVHLSLRPGQEQDSLHAPQKSLPSHAYPSSQPTAYHPASSSQPSYQPPTVSPKRSPYYQGTTQHGLGPQSAPPAPIPSRTHAQAAAQRSPEQQLQEDVATVRNVMQVNKEPPLPPPPDLSALSISQEESAPPRPPLPQGQMPPPRPPPPEEEEEINFPKPQTDEPIMKAAYDLHVEAQKWSSKGNDLIAAAKKMALLMAQMSKYVRGEGGSKKGLIDCAKAIAKASDEVTRLATEIARQCTDKRIRMNLMQVCERIPTIATQLKIISTVKATLLGEPDAEDEEEATEVLVLNAQNLMGAVKETVRQAEAASIKIRTEAGVKMRWVRKSPWYS
ncbi:vinculin-like isoform X3 [Apostichopus japonicus]|uniref:vinculin-like isoform X3 n=1 Tax=Stichopus japonicus TaxID=307972 RepID=UPI003AB69298